MLIREATSHQDLDEAVQIQREVWGVLELDLASRLQLRASQHAGGSVLLAVMPDGAVSGFAYAAPAFVRGEAFWHSDMLAVRSQFRGGGVGQALKWAQRAHALRAGIHRITWTFDPMQAGNAHLNIELLGATSGEYLSDFYGLTSSALHHNLPTDRLLASWILESPRVEARARGETSEPEAGEDRVPIPLAWNSLVSADPLAARDEQRKVEAMLQAAFGRGRLITGFDKPSSSYLLRSGQGQ